MSGKTPRRVVGAGALFWDAVSWLGQTYTGREFFVERDVVWMLQRRLLKIVKKEGLPFRVFSEFKVMEGKRRGILADLAILDDESIALAVEIKYEPDHDREGKDIPKGKFPVVSWNDGVAADVRRVREFVGRKKARAAIALFIDEGCYYRWRRPALEDCAWRPLPPDGQRYLDNRMCPRWIHVCEA